ncbi:MAG: hypothetical protein R2729_11880 [Bryobacteraceae bacterium]
MKGLWRLAVIGALAAVTAWNCGFDQSLREYLSGYFWLPFAEHPTGFAANAKPALDAPFAGMDPAPAPRPLVLLRSIYRGNEANPNPPQALAAARMDGSLTARQREEVELIDAKLDLRIGEADSPAHLETARRKLSAFLARANTPEYLSEARGWLARVHYLLGDRASAGKIYLDEAARTDSNLSRETLASSLQILYGYDGGADLAEHLSEYFDTPEHAAFAIKVVTNPHTFGEYEKFTMPPYQRIKELLAAHGELFRTDAGARQLALLGMRTALRAADPKAAIAMARKVPRNSAVRRDPDFLWMLASANFVTKNYAGAATPLLRLFRSREVEKDKRAAAAYGLCGVYAKTGNYVERIRYGLWLAREVPRDAYWGLTSVADFSVYWALSGLDVHLLLDAEAPEEALREYIAKYGADRRVTYALAVRAARADRYEEAAQLYDRAGTPSRAARMRRTAELHAAAKTGDGQSRYKFAEYVSRNQERLYFNAMLWMMDQRYAFTSAEDWRLLRSERERLVRVERRLKDEQEERWRAYTMLREIAREQGRTELGKRSAELALDCLRRMSERFGRLDEITRGIVELRRWQRGSGEL